MYVVCLTYRTWPRAAAVVGVLRALYHSVGLTMCHEEAVWVG